MSYQSFQKEHRSHDIHGFRRQNKSLLSPSLLKKRLKALLHFHGSHHGSSRTLIRGVPACDTTISSRCRCDTFRTGCIHGQVRCLTDRQGSNADHAGNAYGANNGFQGRTRRLLGTFTVLTRRCTLSIGISPEC